MINKFSQLAPDLKVAHQSRTVRALQHIRGADKPCTIFRQALAVAVRVLDRTPPALSSQTQVMHQN
jgi:hypothetical protein